MFDLIGEAEGHDRETRDIFLHSSVRSMTRLIRRASTNLDIGLVCHSLLRAGNETRGACVAMDIAEYRIVSTLFESTAEQPRVRKVIECYTPVATETQVHEIVVLCDDRCCWSREVEAEAVLDAVIRKGRPR